VQRLRTNAGVTGINSSTGYGGYFTSNTGAVGLYGATDSSSGQSGGVWGHNSNASGNGVYGTGNTGGSFVGNATGVYGSCTGGTCDAGYFTGATGLYATGTTYAGYFVGETYFDGTVITTGSTTTGGLTVSTGDLADFEGDVLGGSSYSLIWGGTCVVGACTASDQRLKKNITPIVGAMDRLLQINGVTFNWKNPDEHQGAGVQTGVIAQDVEKVFPDWIGENGKGFKTVNIDQRAFLGVVVEAFRTVKERADKADARADKAEKELAQQKAVNTDVLDRLDAIERGHPRAPASPLGFNPATGVGAFGIIVGGIALLSSRKKKDEKAS
jgi:hypothetical protein